MRGRMPPTKPATCCPRLQTKTLARIGVCFDTFTSPEFLNAMYLGGRLRTETDQLTLAMDKYLAFQW